MNVITHSLTASTEFEYSEFDWFWYPGMGPKPFSALPLESLPDSQPQLIRALFNVHRFGPPLSVT